MSESKIEDTSSNDGEDIQELLEMKTLTSLMMLGMMIQDKEKKDEKVSEKN